MMAFQFEKFQEMQEYKARCKGLAPGQTIGSIQQTVPNQLKEEDEDEEDD